MKIDDRQDDNINLKSDGLWLAKTVAMALGISLVLNSAVFVNAEVPSGSMMNTIEPGNRFIGSRLSYVNRDPERFDVIVFKYPDDESQNFVKRIIGLPGERLEIINGKVYINDSDEPLDDSFIAEEMQGSFGPYEIPESCYFVLGDNRNHSNDSRYWEHTFVTRDQIIGKASFCYWPVTDIKLIK